jgi:hypothetical protein
MKQKDLTLLIASIFIGIVLSIVFAKLFFSSSKNLQQQVVIVPLITTSFELPNTKYFNSKSIDPTQIINIAPSNNQTLFNQPVN